MGNGNRVTISVFAALTCITLAVAVAQAAAGLTVPPGTVAPQTPRIVGTPGPPTTPPAGDSYGLAGWTAVNIPGWELQTYNYGLGYIINSDGTIGPQAGDTYRYFESAVHIPTGALVQGATYFDYDDSASGDVQMWLYKYAVSATTGGVSTLLWGRQSSGTPGYEGGYEAFSSAITWANWETDTGQADYFLFIVHLGAQSGNDFEGLTLWYQRQISPAPTTATFPDVPPSFWAFQDVEALAASGITEGQPDGNFHPTDPVTRAQMATFLCRALGLHWSDL